MIDPYMLILKDGGYALHAQQRNEAYECQEAGVRNQKGDGHQDCRQY